MTYTHMSNAFRCNADQATALMEAFSVAAEDFQDQEALSLSLAFHRYFPHTRPGEPISGLWDIFQPAFRGYDDEGYPEIGAKVAWFEDNWAVVWGDEVQAGAAVEVIRRVCADEQPRVFSWYGGDPHNYSDEYRVLAVMEEGALTTMSLGDLRANNAGMSEAWRNRISSLRDECDALLEKRWPLVDYLPYHHSGSEDPDEFTIRVEVPEWADPDDLPDPRSVLLLKSLNLSGEITKTRVLASDIAFSFEIWIGTIATQEVVELLRDELLNFGFPEGTSLHAVIESGIHFERLEKGDWHAWPSQALTPRGVATLDALELEFAA